MSATKTYSIHDIALEFDRLFPDDVDETPVEWGEGVEAGYKGHDHGDEPHTVGWFSMGGNVGHPVIDIAAADIQLAGETLAALASAHKLGDVESALAAAGVRFERLV